MFWIYIPSSYQDTFPTCMSNQLPKSETKVFACNDTFNWDTKKSCEYKLYVTSRKIAGSIPDKYIKFFNWPNPSNRTMVMKTTQVLTEMSSRNLMRGVKACRHARLANSSPTVSRFCRKCRNLSVWNAYWSSRLVTGNDLTFLWYI
jgi:hypothetical protein